MRPAYLGFLFYSCCMGGMLCLISERREWYATGPLKAKSMKKIIERSENHRIVEGEGRLANRFMANIATLNCKSYSSKKDKSFLGRITNLIIDNDLHILCLQNISSKNTRAIYRSLNNKVKSMKEDEDEVYNYRHSHTDDVPEPWEDKENKYARLAFIYNAQYLNCLDARMSYMHHDELTVSLKSSMENLKKMGYENIMEDQSPSMICTFFIKGGFGKWIRVANVCSKIDTYNSLRLSDTKGRFEHKHFKKTHLLYYNLSFKRTLVALYNKTIHETRNTKIVFFIVGDFGVDFEGFQASPVREMLASGNALMFLPMNRFSSIKDLRYLAPFECGTFYNAYYFSRAMMDALECKKKLRRSLARTMEKTDFIFHSTSVETGAVYVKSLKSDDIDTCFRPVDDHLCLKAVSVAIRDTLLDLKTKHEVDTEMRSLEASFKRMAARTSARNSKVHGSTETVLGGEYPDEALSDMSLRITMDEMDDICDDEERFSDMLSLPSSSE